MKNSPAMGFIGIGISLISFLYVCWMGWNGNLGLFAIGSLLVSLVTFLYGRGKLPVQIKSKVNQIGKLLFTVAGIMVLLRHPIDTNIFSASADGYSITVKNQAKEAREIEIAISDSDDKIVEIFREKVEPKRQELSKQKTDLTAGKYKFTARTISDDFAFVGGNQLKVISTKGMGQTTQQDEEFYFKAVKSDNDEYTVFVTNAESELVTKGETKGKILTLDSKITFAAASTIYEKDDVVQPAMRQPIYSAIISYIDQVDGQTFLLFAFLAMAIKFVGVLSSAFAWHLLLIGQGIRYNYWQSIVTAFLIGRFIGTFLPSTIGLDFYTTYEAGRYSNKWTRVMTAKVLEKFIGITGLFLGIALTLPFGYEVITNVIDELTKTQENPPENAAQVLAGAILLVTGGVSLVVVTGLVKPKLLQGILGIFQKILPSKIKNITQRFIDAVGAYEGKIGLLLLALVNKFITHFTTAIVYYFTALAIGVVAVSFWPIVFGSNIQILATLLSPTIAGEGAREAFQALLLSKHLGGVPQAVLSASLGFIAAEAATMWGGAFLWTRSNKWRPNSVIIDGQQADFAWLTDDQEPFSLKKILEEQQKTSAK